MCFKTKVVIIYIIRKKSHEAIIFRGKWGVVEKRVEYKVSEITRPWQVSLALPKIERHQMF